MNRLKATILAGVLASGAVQAEGLQLQDILQQVISQHPKTAAMREEGLQQQAKIRKAEAEFDPYFSQKVSSRVSGYYDGNVLTTELSKPLSEMGARLYTRYALAEGSFPVYEAQYDTLSAGEVSVGIAFSLLQGRQTDERRTGLRTAGYALQQWQARYRALLNDQLYQATSTYLKWYESSLKRQALAAMMKTLSGSEKALQRRVEQGDAAQMTLDEFSSNTLEIELLQADTQQLQAMTQAKLDYYINTPEPLAAPGTTRQQWPFFINATRLSDLQRQLAKHPLQQVLMTDLQTSRAQLTLAQNTLLPTLDIQASVARDIGSGPANLDGTESKLGLNFSYPLGNRKGRAEQQIQQAKIRQTEFKITDLQQQLMQQFQAAVARWEQSRRVLTLRQQASELAARLQRAEQARFDSGDADMFVLNARQNKLIKARMDAISAHVSQRQAELDLFYAAAALDSLALQPSAHAPLLNQPTRSAAGQN